MSYQNPDNPYRREKWPAHLTLEFLANEKMPVFVRNTTRPRGQLAINFPGPHGRVHVEKIPRTHLPIELSGKMSLETIMQSDDFRQCMAKGVVELVRPDLAFDEATDPDNIDTINDLQLSQFSAKNAFVSKNAQDMSKTVEGKVDPDAPQLQQLGVDTNVVNPRVMRFITQIQNGDISIKAAMSELKTMEPELSENDCSYIVSNGPDGQVRSYAQKVLARLQGKGLTSYNVADDDAPALTPQEQEAERQREMQARSQQATGGQLKPPPAV